LRPSNKVYVESFGLISLQTPKLARKIAVATVLPAPAKMNSPAEFDSFDYDGRNDRF
jgi:hypothetical protein